MTNINTPLPVAAVQKTVSSTSLTLVTFGFTAEEIDSSAQALITINTSSVRFRIDGTAPTVSIGHLSSSVDSTKFFTISGNENLQQLQMIRDGVSDSEVFITLMG